MHRYVFYTIFFQIDAALNNAKALSAFILQSDWSTLAELPEVNSLNLNPQKFPGSFLPCATRLFPPPTPTPL